MTTTAFSLVPENFAAAAFTRPFFFLSFHPIFETVLLDVIKIGLHVPVVGPFVIHEGVQFQAGVFRAEATELQFLFPGALSELTSEDVFIDIVALATVTVHSSAGATIETAVTVLR